MFFSEIDFYYQSELLRGFLFVCLWLKGTFFNKSEGIETSANIEAMEIKTNLFFLFF